MLTGAYIAGDNNNDLLINIWLTQTAIKFALSLNSMLIQKSAHNGEHYSKNCRGLKNTGRLPAAKADHLWQP